MMKNEMTEAQKKMNLEKILKTAYRAEIGFRLSVCMNEDFSFFQEKGFEFDVFPESEKTFSEIRGNVLVAAILTMSGARVMACDYLLKASFNDFYKSLETKDDRENFKFMVYGALKAFE